MRSASVYVHFPWCLAKCPYCDFVSYAIDRDAIDHRAYADAVIAEVEARAAAIAEDGIARRIGSIFFGGGTPSLWEPRELGRALARIRALFPCANDLEITVECNPTSLDHDRASALRDVGVNRLSVGTQSLRSEQLSYLGRLHDPDGAIAAVRAALATGLRVSTDLIFGLPAQSPDDARAQASTLADLGLSHLSCYQLTIEAGTRFGELAKRGRLPLADDGLVAEGFFAIDEALTARGLTHYEISNYAKPGEEARHNLAYWHGDEYVGLGAAAFGFLRAGAHGVRYRNAIDPKAYVAQASKTRRDLVGEGDQLTITSEPLDADALVRERLMLGLRLAKGVDLEAIAKDLDVPVWTPERTREVEKLVARGRLARDGGRLWIPRAMWIWADDTSARLF